MKVRLPKNSGQGANLQQLTARAQKMQENMEIVTARLEEKVYEAEAPGGQVKVRVKGTMELVELSIEPEILMAENAEMVADFVTLAVNGAIRAAAEDKQAQMEQVSEGFSFPGMF